MRVLVAMSGGVDSSVAAALLKQQGFDVVGVTMRLYDAERGPGVRGCCGSAEARDAARVARKLGFPHYTWDFRTEFADQVITDFCTEYGRGRTPNPCLRCNERIKFEFLLDRAGQLDAEVIATGHHARIVKDETGFSLCRAKDRHKDQTYFLHTLTQPQMERLLLPVGEYTKDEVRAMARKLELPVADKPDSQEICFVPDDDYVGFLKRHRPGLFEPGPVLDMQGRELGRHEGIAAFTVGQRKGLGIAFGERRYVVRLDTVRNAVILGAESDVYVRVVEAGDARWVAGVPPQGPVEAWVKVRSQGEGGAAMVEPLSDSRVRVAFSEPQWAPTPGQAIVYWQGDCVLGGATIERSRSE